MGFFVFFISKESVFAGLMAFEMKAGHTTGPYSKRVKVYTTELHLQLSTDKPYLFSNTSADSRYYLHDFYTQI